MTIAAGNLEQAQAWNGDEGLRWTEQEERYERSAARHAEHLVAAASIAAHEHVLDVGCGCGGTTREVARLAAHGRALGVDLSEPMLARDRQRAADEQLPNVEFICADAQEHQFPPDTFDVVISKYGAMFFGDPVRAFANLHDAARPDARLVLLAWQELQANEWLTRIRAALGGDKELPQPPPNAPGAFALADPDHVRRLLGQAGWDDVQMTALADPVHLGSDPDDAYTFVSRMGITVGLLEWLGEGRDESLRRLRALMHDAMTDEGVELPSRSWLIRAVRA